MKKIGVLTSGGDAPGMNAAVRAVCRSALNKGMEVVGIMRGYNGLLNGEVIEMNAKTVSGIIQRGGTCLYTARCNEFRSQEGVLKGKAKCEEPDKSEKNTEVWLLPPKGISNAEAKKTVNERSKNVIVFFISIMCFFEDN